jgi:DNA anti-recombination protein RmuC
MKEVKGMMLRQNEATLQQEITRADEQKTNIERALQQISNADDTQAGEDSAQSRRELLHEIQQQRASNDAFRNMCEEALSRTVFERTGQKIKGVKATDHSSAVAGFINTSGEELKINQDISDVTASNYSFAGAGVIKSLNFADLHSSGPADNMK